MAEPVTIDLTQSDSPSSDEIHSDDFASEALSSEEEDEQEDDEDFDEEYDAETYEDWSPETSSDESDEEKSNTVPINTTQPSQPHTNLHTPLQPQQNSFLLAMLPLELRQEIIFLTYRIAPKDDGTLIIYSELAFVCRQLRTECKFAKRIWLPEPGPLVVTLNVKFPDVDAIERHFVRVGRRRGVGWEGFRDVVVGDFVDAAERKNDGHVSKRRVDQ